VQFLNIFNYAPRALFIAYGTSILLSSPCLVCGLFAICGNKVAYTNNFSAIMRMTKDRRFNDCIEDEEDCSGADPLPEHIAHVKIEYVDGLKVVG
jgi:hypothetical protein